MSCARTRLRWKAMIPVASVKDPMPDWLNRLRGVDDDVAASERQLAAGCSNLVVERACGRVQADRVRVAGTAVIGGVDTVGVVAAADAAYSQSSVGVDRGEVGLAAEAGGVGSE